MTRRGCWPHRIVFSLILLTWTRVTLAALIRSHSFSNWPKPPCKMYYPIDPDYEANCPDVIALVCATNGLNYKNECFFCIDRWEFGPHIEFVKYGKCE